MTSTTEAEESTPLAGSLPSRSYGSARHPQSRNTPGAISKLPSLRGLREWHRNSSAGSPSTSRLSFFKGGSLRGRPLSKYDDVVAEDDEEPHTDVQLNGIRVWYSSFTSIDWLHDRIKDSARQYRLHNRKSFRGKIRIALDRFIGWVVVSIVAFLTAVVAFMIVRSEMFLYDLKEGYCSTAWYKPQKFCCMKEEGYCKQWRSWAEVFGAPEKEGTFAMIGIEHVSWTIIAVCLALLFSRNTSLISFSSWCSRRFRAFSLFT